MEQTFYVYAAGLGGVKLLELDGAGQKVKGYVYGGGSLLAEQELYPSAPGTYNITWQHANPGSASWVETDMDRVFGRREMDPLGADVGAYDPFRALLFARLVLGLIFFMARAWKVFTLGLLEHVRKFFLPFSDTFLPVWSLWAVGAVIPFVELVAGALVILGRGRARRSSLWDLCWRS